MKKPLLFLLLSLFMVNNSQTQETFVQYFDGADTSIWNSIIIHIDTNADNIWQVGTPQKVIFNYAATQPNVIISDTILNYPLNNNSSFEFSLNEAGFYPGIIALQWKQKLDFTENHDGGIIEFWNGQEGEWQNVFNNPYVYAFYGFDISNADTLLSGEYAFSGTDTTWRDIWLCFDYNWMTYLDTLTFKYRIKTDEIGEEKEGWMMDNFMAHITIIHSVNENEQLNYVDIWPNPSSGRLNIDIRKTDGFHIIEKMEIYNIVGGLMESFKNIPTRFFIDVNNYPDGIYLLKVQTNLQTETIRLVIHH